MWWPFKKRCKPIHYETWTYEVTFVLSEEAMARIRNRRIAAIYARLEPYGA